VIRWVEPLLAWLRPRPVPAPVDTDRLRRELDLALRLRRRGRARRQEAARKAAQTRLARRFEDLKPLKGDTV